MPSAKLNAIQSNMNGGEISPLAFGRFDTAKFANALKRMENFLPSTLGGAIFRPGTVYVGATKNAAARARLIPFQFNTAQAYILELGDEYMRFFANRAQVVVDNSAPIDSYTVFLAHFDGTDGQASYTAEVGGAISFFRDAQLDTTQSKFGGSSLLLDGSDYLTVPDSTSWDIAKDDTEDYTIDLWVRLNSRSGTDVLVSQYQDNDNKWFLQHVAGTGLQFRAVSGGSDVITVNGSEITDGNWHHVALTKKCSGGPTVTWRMFLDGTTSGSTSDASEMDITGSFVIGRDDADQNYFDGWMDEIRVSKGVARWTANFTAPTSAYGGASDWATSTSYVVGDYVNNGGTVYLCLVAHTSGTFATDLAAGKWSAQSALEVATPYQLSDISAIHTAQNADTMYLFHPDYPVYKLQRQSATSFTLTQVDFVRGPFLDSNITSTTITPSSATGSTTLTASTGIFESGHVGSYWKVNSAVVKITGYTSATVVTGTVQAEPDGTAGNIGGTSAYTAWAEGAFSEVRGYPSTGAFFGQRLVVGGTAYQPQHFYATVIGAFENMKVNASDPSAAYIYLAGIEEVNVIRWIASGANALQLGTSGGTVSASVPTGTITNDNPPQINQDTNYGTAINQPKRISSLLYYIQKNGFQLRELNYNYLAQRNFAGDMNLIADHILRDGGGAHSMDYQLSPCDRIWVVRNDGQIAVLTRNPEQEIMGWGRIKAGTDALSYGIFESIASIRTDNGDDEIWVIVKRNINGSTVRYIEYFSPERFDDDWDAIRVDSALSIDNPINITGATQANPVVITAPAHGFSNGAYVKIDNVEGMEELNGEIFKIKNKTDNTFELTDTSDANINGTAYGEYVMGGEVRVMYTAISGLSHLEGETVTVQADGVMRSTTYTVTSGAITLGTRAAVVHIGLPYTGTLQFLKAGDMNTQFKNSRFFIGNVRLDRSLGFKIGQDEDNLLEVEIAETQTKANYYAPNAGVLYTGDTEDFFTSWWDKQAEPLIYQDKSNPLNILAAGFRREVTERD